MTHFEKLSFCSGGNLLDYESSNQEEFCKIDILKTLEKLYSTLFLNIWCTYRVIPLLFLIIKSIFRFLFARIWASRCSSKKRIGSNRHIIFHEHILDQATLIIYLTTVCRFNLDKICYWFQTLFAFYLWTKNEIHKNITWKEEISVNLQNFYYPKKSQCTPCFFLFSFFSFFRKKDFFHSVRKSVFWRSL